MCGIIGFIDVKERREAIDTALNLLKHRGTDSYGYILERGATTETDKSLSKLSTLKSLNAKDKSDFILLHNRKTSVGGTTIPLAHPIQSKNKKVQVIHNGTKKPLFNTIDDAKSDTEAIAEIISLHFEASPLLSKLLEDCGVVFAKNQETGEVLFHTDGCRPLFISKNRQIIASEPVGLGEWFLIKPTIGIYNSFLHFMKKVKVHSKSVTLGKDDNVTTQLCDGCNKMHLETSKYGKCFECEVLGRKVTNYSSYSSNYTPTVLNKVYEMSIDNKTWTKKQLTRKTWDSVTYSWNYYSGNEEFFYIRKVKKTTPIIKTLKVGKKYLFWDTNDNIKIKGTYLGLNPGKETKYPYQVEFAGKISYYKNVELPAEHVLLQVKTDDGTIFNAYIKTKGKNYTCINPHTLTEFEAISISPRPLIYENELIEVSNDNANWEYALATKNIPLGNQNPITVSVFTKNDEYKEDTFKYYKTEIA